MPAQPSYLSTNRFGTYYFRMVTPAPLRIVLGLQREIRRSLKTDSLRLALRRARQYVARYEAVFDKVLNVVNRDDYQPTDEDIELFIEQIEQADDAKNWGLYSSGPTEPAQAAKSVLSDDEWCEIEEKQRRKFIATLLTGQSSRAIPESQQELAEQLYASGRSLPIPQFKKLLPTLLERLALQPLNSPGPAPIDPKPIQQPVGPTLYELWKLHWDSQTRLAKGRKKSERTKEDEQGHACRLNILSGNKPVNLLTIEDFERIYLQVFEIRRIRGAKIPDPCSAPESILIKEGETPIGAGTIEKISVRLGALHGFAHKKGMTTIHPDAPQRPEVNSSPAGKMPLEKAFTQNDLRAIFSGYLYTGTELARSNAVYPYQFWLPLLGLFTGGRLNELCQLDTEDVSKNDIDGIWTISLMDDELDRPLPKSLKNQSSRRILPIHSELIRMGFLDFVGEASKQGREKLFSDGLTYNPKKGWGSNATHFYCRFPSPSTPAAGYFFKCGIRSRDSDGETDRENFHSFRHTFTDMARELGPDAYLVLPDLTGHSRSNEGQVAKYGNGFTISKKQAVLEALVIPVDLANVTYADFEGRLGEKLQASIQRHREECGLNQAERLA